MTQDDRMETITDRAEIRATDEPDERGDFPCCADRAHKESLGGDSESGTYNRSSRPPAGPCTDERTTPAPASGAGLDLDAIEARAKAVPRGWDRWADWQHYQILALVTPTQIDGWAHPEKRADAMERTEAAVEHIVGMDPATTLALVAEVRRLTADLDMSQRLLATMDHWAEVAETCERKANESHARRETAEAEVVTLRARLAAVEAKRDEFADLLARALPAVAALARVEALGDGNPDHADTCGSMLTPGAGYPCSCWQADLRAALATTGEGQ